MGIEIFPSRILPLNQCDFFRSPPTLQLFFSAESPEYTVKLLAIDQTRARVFFRETLEGPNFMLPNSQTQIAGNTDIQRAAQTVHNVYPVLVFHSRAPISTGVLRLGRAPSLRMTANRASLCRRCKKTNSNTSTNRYPRLSDQVKRAVPTGVCGQMHQRIQQTFQFTICLRLIRPVH